MKFTYLLKTDEEQGGNYLQQNAHHVKYFHPHFNCLSTGRKLRTSENEID